jgi:site-specific DNA recombinase
MGAVSKPAEKCAIYYRVSTDDQIDNIKGQEVQVEALVARQGYGLYKVYDDPGIPGDEIDKRPGFKRMLKDAEDGKFTVIVCDDVDRFGRFDAATYGSVIVPLREAGVRLETVNQGKIDWEDTLSLLNDMMRMAFKKEQSRDTARRVARGQIAWALEGYWMGGPPPYGYRTYVALRYTDAKGKKRERKKLEPNPETKETLDWMFREFATGRWSLNAMAAELHKQNALTPAGRRPGEGKGPGWQGPSVHKILKNKAYLGIIEFGDRPGGKYVRFSGGTSYTDVKAKRMVGRDGKKLKRAGRDRVSQEQLIVVKGAHTPLVDQETFDSVQAILAGNTRSTSPKGNGGDYLLSGGLLKCGDCGCTMGGMERQKGANTRERRYRCNRYGFEQRRGCYHNWVPEQAMNELVIRKIESALLNPERLEQFREEARLQAAESRKRDDGRAKSLRAEYAEAVADVEAAERNMLVARTPELMERFARGLPKLEARRDRLAADLAKLDRQPDADAAERDIRLMERRLRRLRDSLRSGELPAVRAVLRELVSFVVLNFTHEPVIRAGKEGVRSKFSHGVIYVNAGDELGRVVRSAAGTDLQSQE